jgi:hypothetical protein
MRPNVDALDARTMRPRQHQSLGHVAAVIAILAFLVDIASADQQRRTSSTSFEVPHSDLANAEALANRLAALSPRVNRDEANLLADCAYATVSQLRRQYRMFGTPIFNNFLVYHGLRKRGYCYQWAVDLLLALDALKLNSLELRWAEAHAGNWRENNCIVVTAKGQPFDRGLILECWKHFGHLRWGPVVSDPDPYVENAAYARFIRARSASKASAPNQQLALQTQSEAKQTRK